MATIIIETGADAVTFLKSQHQQVRSMFADVLAADGDERADAFNALRRMLAVHEAAEEEVIHPAARKVIANGEAIVNARLQEENEAKRALTELETLVSLDIDSECFESRFLTLQAKVFAHTESEESLEFDLLAKHLDPIQLTGMRKAAQFVEAMAPTRPHPGIESATANILVGPFVSMLDRARDALGGRPSHR